MTFSLSSNESTTNSTTKTHFYDNLNPNIPNIPKQNPWNTFKKNIGASGPGGPEFAEFQKETEADYGVVFAKSLADLPEVPEGGSRLALISGRTGDNPRLLGEAIKVSFLFCCCCFCFGMEWGLRIWILRYKLHVFYFGRWLLIYIHSSPFWVYYYPIFTINNVLYSPNIQYSISININIRI